MEFLSAGQADFRNTYTTLTWLTLGCSVQENPQSLSYYRPSRGELQEVIGRRARFRTAFGTSRRAGRIGGGHVHRPARCSAPAVRPCQAEKQEKMRKK